MSRLDREPDIVQLAHDLGLRSQKEPVGEIVDYCHRRVQSWAAETGRIRSISELERVVCANLGLVFKEVWTDDDLERLIKKYVAVGEYVFAALRTDLNDETFATLIRRTLVRPGENERYVAVVDCRGGKAARRFFTRWHEMSHLLTLTGDMGLPFHRSTDEKTPTERLMDTIAATFAYFDPIFRPIVDSRIREHSDLTFQTVETIRNSYHSEASFQSALLACIERTQVPALYLEAKGGYTNREREQIKSGQLSLFESTTPVPRLRAVQVTRNGAARQIGLNVHRNMRIPEGSTIYGLFLQSGRGSAVTDASGYECLRDWQHSDGTVLGASNVFIEARRIGDGILALMRGV